MLELTTIGDYEVRAIDCSGPIARYTATHVVLPRKAFIELLAPDAPRMVAVKLMRRACILEALHHPAVPRVFECGMLEGRPWIAIERDDHATLYDQLLHRRLEVRELLTLLEDVAAFLAHAHARGVLHGDITPRGIVREPNLMLTRWEHACVLDTELSSDSVDVREDVFALARTAREALGERDTIPESLTNLLTVMLAKDAAMRPTATEVVAAACAIRDALGPDQAEALETKVDAAISSLTDEAEEPEIVIDYRDRNDDEPILLDRPRRADTRSPTPISPHLGYSTSVMVDLDACG